MMSGANASPVLYAAKPRLNHHDYRISTTCRIEFFSNAVILITKMKKIRIYFTVVEDVFIIGVRLNCY